MDISKLIINRPALQSKSQKTTGVLVTTFAWALWTYLWVPFLGLLGWYLGVELFTSVMDIEGLRAISAALPRYIDYVAISSGTLIVWALINWIRFRGPRDKRAKGVHKQVVVSQLAAHAGVSAISLGVWQQTKRLVAHYFNDGKLSHMDTGPNATYIGHPAIPVGEYTRRYAFDLDHAMHIKNKVEKNQQRSGLDLDLNISLEQEIAIVQKKIVKLNAMRDKYTKDLAEMAETETPYYIVPLFAAQKRRLHAVELGLNRYLEKQNKLVSVQALQTESLNNKRLAAKNAIIIEDGTVILDGRSHNSTENYLVELERIAQNNKLHA